MAKYFGSWGCYEEMAADFGEYQRVGEKYARVAPGEIPMPNQILFASYEQGGYEGDAFVLFTQDGKLYEVHGSHCSCYGLEGQWSPEETSWKALDMRVNPPEGDQSFFPLRYHDEDARNRLKTLVKDNL